MRKNALNLILKFLKLKNFARNYKPNYISFDKISKLILFIILSTILMKTIYLVLE
jgi:hypothetical protein